MANAPYDRSGAFVSSDVEGLGIDRKFIAHFQVSADGAIAPDTDAVLAATALTDSAQAIKTNITNPAVPRSISIMGNASGIVGNVVVKGTNFAGTSISETIALNGTSTVEGSEAFKSVTEIDMPVQTHEGTDTVSVGIGSKLGLPYKLAHNTVLLAFLDNVKESTAPTVTVSASAIESNTIVLNSALAAKAVDAYIIV